MKMYDLQNISENKLPAWFHYFFGDFCTAPNKFVKFWDGTREARRFSIFNMEIEDWDFAK